MSSWGSGGCTSAACLLTGPVVWCVCVSLVWPAGLLSYLILSYLIPSLTSPMASPQKTLSPCSLSAPSCPISAFTYSSEPWPSPAPSPCPTTGPPPYLTSAPPPSPSLHRPCPRCPLPPRMASSPDCLSLPPSPPLILSHHPVPSCPLSKPRPRPPLSSPPCPVVTKHGDWYVSSFSPSGDHTYSWRKAPSHSCIRPRALRPRTIHHSISPHPEPANTPNNPPIPTVPSPPLRAQFPGNPTADPPAAPTRLRAMMGAAFEGLTAPLRRLLKWSGWYGRVT